MVATKYRKLGDWQVLALGLGGMPLSIENRPDEDRAIEVIHRAFDLGVNHIDTAFGYYLAGGTAFNGEEQHNEKLIAKAIESYTGDKSNIVVASKAGHFRCFGLNNEPIWGQQGNPRYIYETGKKSRDALKTDSIDLYYYHRPDLNVKYHLSIEALAKLLDEKVIKYAGISNASIEQINIARSILGDKLIAVQNQFSPAHTSTLDTLNYCASLNIAFLPWSPLGGFRDEKLLVKDQPFDIIGNKYGVSKQRVILAWELSKGNHIIPIPGFRRTQTLEDSLKALELELSYEDIEYLNRSVIN